MAEACAACSKMPSSLCLSISVSAWHQQIIRRLLDNCVNTLHTAMHVLAGVVVCVVDWR